MKTYPFKFLKDSYSEKIEGLIFWERRGDQPPVRDGVSVGNRAGPMAPTGSRENQFLIQLRTGGKIPVATMGLDFDDRRGNNINDSLAAALGRQEEKWIPNRSSPNGWTNGKDDALENAERHCQRPIPSRQSL